MKPFFSQTPLLHIFDYQDTFAVDLQLLGGQITEHELVIFALGRMQLGNVALAAIVPEGGYAVIGITAAEAIDHITRCKQAHDQRTAAEAARAA